jgi:hypothetical protein
VIVAEAGDSPRLRISRDPEGTDLVPTSSERAEEEAKAKVLEGKAKEAERRARLEAEAKQEAERSARLEAESKLAELVAELARLRDGR